MTIRTQATRGAVAKARQTTASLALLLELRSGDRIPDLNDLDMYQERIRQLEQDIESIREARELPDISVADARDALDAAYGKGAQALLAAGKGEAA